MTATLNLILPTTFAISAMIYLWLAIRIARQSSPIENNTISHVLFLISAMIAGAAFSYETSDPAVYGIGRVLTFFSAGFLPVALYVLYRQYTVGPPGPRLLAALSIVPISTVVLAITNPMHYMLWMPVETDGGFTNATEHWWFSRVFSPYAYGLFGYSVVALAGNLHSVARAHRRKLGLFLVCAVLPYGVNLASTWFGVGPANFPLTVVTLTLLLPVYWWLTISLRVYAFRPLAYQTLFDQLRDPIIVLDKSQRIVSANHPAQTLLGYPEAELMGQHLWEDLPEAKAILDQVAGGGLAKTVRLNTNQYYELQSAPLIGPADQDQGTVVVLRDITKRKQAFREVADRERIIRSLVEHSANGVLRFARNGKGELWCTFANRAAARFLQEGNGTLTGMPVEQLTSLQPHKLLEHVSNPTALGVGYETAIVLEGHEVWLRITSELVGQDLSVTLTDITERKRTENEILAVAHRDPLTGLLNRRGFENDALTAIQRCEIGAVLYLDLNNFKSINDRFGHHAGDALLTAFGHRLRRCLRPEDILARLGGDEFAIVLPDASIKEAAHVAERLLETTSAPYLIQGHEIGCATSVGISLMPAHGTDLWGLVRVADQAMYGAKSFSSEEAANDRAAYVAAIIAS